MDAYPKHSHIFVQIPNSATLIYISQQSSSSGTANYPGSAISDDTAEIIVQLTFVLEAEDKILSQVQVTASIVLVQVSK